MIPVHARAIYIKQEAHDDPRSMARVERMLPSIHCDTEPTVIDDAAWHQLVIDEGLHSLPRHGTRGAGRVGRAPRRRTRRRARRTERPRRPPAVGRSSIYVRRGVGTAAVDGV